MFRIEISANSADEFADQIKALAEKLGGDPQPAATESKTTRRSRKASEPETAGQDVGKSDEKSTDTSEPPADSKPEPASEKKAEPEGEKLTVDSVRDFVISDYLNACFEKQEDRTKAFQALLKEFDAGKFKDIPDEKLGEVKARAEALILEAAKK